MELHRSLLHFQKRLVEIEQKKSFSPHETLQMTLSHPDFEWLRALSSLIVSIDEALDDKTNPPLKPLWEDVTQQLKTFLTTSAESKEFNARLESALTKEPSLTPQVTELKRLLG